jgi:hypothetical protein
MLDGRDPYEADYGQGPLAARPVATTTHFPYLPGMLVFGMPRAVDGTSPWADARVWFAVVATALTLLALATRAGSERRDIRLAQVLLALPTGAVLMATGGDDLPVLALALLALVMLSRERPGWAGVAGGAAAALKQTAWLLLPFLVMASANRRRTAGAAALMVAPLIVPFVLWHPGAFIEDFVKYPLGLGQGDSAAGTVTLGAVLADILPGGHRVAALLFLLAVLGVGAWLLIKRPWPGPAGVARAAGVIWLVAFVLAPAARLGYLVYPINLLTWSVVLVPGRREAGSGDPGPSPVAVA